MGFEKGQGRYSAAREEDSGRRNEKVRNEKGEREARRDEREERVEEMEARAKVHERSGGWAVRAGECRAFLLVPALALLETREADQPDRRIVESDLICAYIPFSLDMVFRAKVKEDFRTCTWRRKLRRISHSSNQTLASPMLAVPFSSW